MMSRTVSRSRGTVSALALVLVAVIQLAFIAELRAQNALRTFGQLMYPAKGNIHLDEGTVELYVISGFDSEEEWKHTSSYAVLFDVVFPELNWHYVLNFITWQHGISMVGYSQPQQSYVSFGHPRWKPGEHRTVAWTWSGRKRSLIVDGKYQYAGKHGAPGDSRDNIVEGWLQGDLTTARLVLGAGVFSVDEFRVSSIARTPEELIALQSNSPVADAHTLLLDHCDGGPAEIISGFSGETGGTLSGSYEIINGKYGKAIKLWKEGK
jgi:hypothetical protein